MNAAISIHGATVGYTAPVLRDIDLEVGAGEVLAVVGRSGVGKTTLLRLVAGLLKPSSGGVSLLGAAPERARQQKRVGFVAQDARLHPWRTVLENVSLPLEVNRAAKVNGHVTPAEWVGRVGLEGATRAYPHQLSGGMRQRVALARSLVLDPEILLMDEPLASLDELTREDLREELARLWEGTSRAVLYVTHDISEAVQLADRVVAIGGRPARICGEVRVTLARPRDRRIRRDARFQDLIEEVRAHLR
ncbi:MAG TPA: ABC transporter ATP-binding protein [Candidatus Limnocylindria bacterium]|nr:ABC transporter ATP-binding protein [Candidatus Limnocylindria bacterium]